MGEFFEGQPGDQTFVGGAGSDTVSYANASGGVKVRLTVAGSQDVGGGQGFDTLVSIENLIGSAYADSLAGSAGANVLDGGAGADYLVGGAGDDVYIIDAVGDQVVEAAGAGTDLIRSSISRTLGANVENLELSGSADINASGNALANVLTGNSGNNTLNGGGGNDSLQERRPVASVSRHLCRSSDRHQERCRHRH